MDHLHRGAFGQTQGSKFDPDAGLLDTTERCIGPDSAMVVDPHAAAFETRREPARCVDVARPDGAAQAIFAGVCAGDHVLDIMIADDRDGGSELLLVDESHALGRVGNNGHRVKEAGSCHGIATAQDAGALLAGTIHQSLHTLELHQILDGT